MILKVYKILALILIFLFVSGSVFSQKKEKKEEERKVMGIMIGGQMGYGLRFTKNEAGDKDYESDLCFSLIGVIPIVKDLAPFDFDIKIGFGFLNYDLNLNVNFLLVFNTDLFAVRNQKVGLMPYFGPSFGANFLSQKKTSDDTFYKSVDDPWPIYIGVDGGIFYRFSERFFIVLDAKWDFLNLNNPKDVIKSQFIISLGLGFVI